MGAGQAKDKSTADQIKLALPGVDVAKAPEFSWEEIRKHNSMDDCWVVLHGIGASSFRELYSI
jgi:cytochrome b involved in lipid metabolism